MRGLRTVNAAVVLGAAVIVVVALVAFVPFLDQRRDVLAASPGPPAMFRLTTVEIAPQHRLCLDHFALGPRTQVLRMSPGTFRRPGPRLNFEISPAGFPPQRVTVAGYADNAALALPIDAPPHAVAGRICVTNVGRHSVVFPATNELRSMSRTESRVDGALQNSDVSFSLLERRPGSIAGRFGDVMRNATFWWPIGAWAGWVLAVLVCVLVPSLALWATSRAARSPRD